MAAPHRIRLHGPWIVQSSLEGSIPHTVPMPGPIPPSAEANSGEAVILERAFGKPTNLGEAAEVDLVIESPASIAEIILNGSTLKSPSESVFRCGIRELLQGRNLLRIVLAAPAAGTVPFGNLRLEIADGPAP